MFRHCLVGHHTFVDLQRCQSVHLQPFLQIPLYTIQSGIVDNSCAHLVSHPAQRSGQAKSAWPSFCTVAKVLYRVGAASSTGRDFGPIMMMGSRAGLLSLQCWRAGSAAPCCSVTGLSAAISLVMSGLTRSPNFCCCLGLVRELSTRTERDTFGPLEVPADK